MLDITFYLSLKVVNDYLPPRRKLVKQEDGRLVTSTGEIR